MMPKSASLPDLVSCHLGAKYAKGSIPKTPEDKTESNLIVSYLSMASRNKSLPATLTT